jgi:hypothetical protein
MVDKVSTGAISSSLLGHLYECSRGYGKRYNFMGREHFTKKIYRWKVEGKGYF